MGYIAGSIHDETLAALTPLCFSRLQEFAIAVVSILLAEAVANGSWRTGVIGRERLATLLVFTTTAGGLTIQAPSIGFRINAEAIRSQLGGSLTTRHLDISYPKELSKEQATRIAADHEFRYLQLKRVFGANPHRIQSYVFRDAAEKRRWLGTGAFRWPSLG